MFAFFLLPDKEGCSHVLSLLSARRQVFALTQPPADPPGKRGGLSPREVALAAQGFAHQPTSALRSKFGFAFQY